MAKFFYLIFGEVSLKVGCSSKVSRAVEELRCIFLCEVSLLDMPPAPPAPDPGRLSLPVI